MVPGTGGTEGNRGLERGAELAEGESRDKGGGGMGGASGAADTRLDVLQRRRAHQHCSLSLPSADSRIRRLGVGGERHVLAAGDRVRVDAEETKDAECASKEEQRRNEGNRNCNQAIAPQRPYCLKGAQFDVQVA